MRSSTEAYHPRKASMYANPKHSPVPANNAHYHGLWRGRRKVIGSPSEQMPYPEWAFP